MASMRADGERRVDSDQACPDPRYEAVVPRTHHATDLADHSIPKAEIPAWKMSDSS